MGYFGIETYRIFNIQCILSLQVLCFEILNVNLDGIAVSMVEEDESSMILCRNKEEKHDIQDKNDLGKEEIYTCSSGSNDPESNMEHSVV